MKDNKNWEIRFRDRFWWGKVYGKNPENKFSGSECEVLIDFIRKEIEAARKEGYKLGIKDLGKEYLKNHDKCFEAHEESLLKAEIEIRKDERTKLIEELVDILKGCGVNTPYVGAPIVNREQLVSTLNSKK